MPACLIAYLTVLLGYLKGISDATWPKRMYYLPWEHLLLFQYFLSVSNSTNRPDTQTADL